MTSDLADRLRRDEEHSLSASAGSAMTATSDDSLETGSSRHEEVLGTDGDAGAGAGNATVAEEVELVPTQPPPFESAP